MRVSVSLMLPAGSWAQHEPTRDLVLSVNVSPRQFRQADFVAQVQAAVQRHAIGPARLKLELTEGMLVKDIDDVIMTMETLKQTGVRISPDDFGTGYSSLLYLQNLPLDQIRIDQSFVRDIAVSDGGNAVVQTMISIAHHMNLNVMAEGVGTNEQLQLLRSMGCMQFQGFLFSKPVTLA